MADPAADAHDDLFENAPCGYLSADASGLITRANRTLLGWIGARSEDVVGALTVADLLAPRSRLHYTAHCVPLLNADGRFDEVILGLDVPGADAMAVMTSAVVRPGESGQPERLLVTMLPAVERLDYERELRDARANEQRARERMEHLQEITQVLAATLEPTGIASTVLTEGLAGTRAATGAVLLRDGDSWATAARVPSDAPAEPPADQLREAVASLSPVLSADRRHWVAPLQADGRLHGVLWVRTEDGALLDEDAAFLGTCAGQGGQALERARLFDVLSELAGSDDLTGLANRRAWDAVARRELAQARRTGNPLCVAIIDLDDFKAYNDAHGHPAGDQLLRDLAAGWRAVVREGDLLARYGGEEFALLLPACAAPEGRGCVDRLRRTMPRDRTCSVGLAQAEVGESLEDLLERADAALYRAKRAGRDRVEIAPPPEQPRH